MQISCIKIWTLYELLFIIEHLIISTTLTQVLLHFAYYINFIVLQFTKLGNDVLQLLIEQSWWSPTIVILFIQSDGAE